MEQCPASSESGLLLEAFQVFTRASSSLESAFQQLQARAQRLSEELELKNKALERSLRDKEEVEKFLNTVLERLPCGVLALDHNGNVTLCNPTAARILEEPCADGEVRRRQSAAFKDFLADSVTRDTGVSDMEVPYVRGEELRILATSGTPLTGSSGERSGTLHIIRDITRLKTLEEQSKRSERLSAMGEMAVELAHEIRNPLGSIELFASLLEKELPSGGDPVRWAENIRVASRSLNNIVSNMLQFANPLSPVLKEVDLHDVIAEVVSFIEPVMRQREIVLESRLRSLAPEVFGDRGLLRQLIMNLLLNAMQAMPSKGSVVIETSDPFADQNAACTAVQMCVKDSGVGIAPENLARIFDPFFTTNHNGTGLGLSVVNQIVEKHSGSIRVESELRVGTMFTVVLPGARIASGAA